MPKPKYHIVVCTNARPPGHPKPSCGSAGSASLLMAFNIGLMQKGRNPWRRPRQRLLLPRPLRAGTDRRRLSGRHLVLQSDGSRRGDDLGRAHQGRQAGSEAES